MLEPPDPTRERAGTSPNASEYPTKAHTTATTPTEAKLIIIVFSTFFERTSPP